MTPSALLALAMTCAPTVHPDTAKDVARIESGFNPYAIGVVGQSRGVFPKNLQDALAHVERLKAQGKNFSVGLMQINQSNFKKYNVTPEKLFNPCTNLSVFEKIITDCYLRGGTLQRALSCYYSGNFNTGQRAETAFSGTSYTQRIGYVVPSTTQDKKANQKSGDSVIYPDSLIRGIVPSHEEPITSDISYPPTVIRGNLVIPVQKGIN